MNRVDATPLVGEKAEPQVPIEHPVWCDRSLCTVRGWAEVAEGDDAGTHMSANLAVPDLYNRLGSSPVHLRQTLYRPHAFNVAVLVVGDVELIINYDSPLLWALVDQHAAMKKIFTPAMMRQGRAAAKDYVRHAREMS